MKKIKRYVKNIENGKAINCFAMGKLGKCSALSATNCSNCKFFKTEEQVQAERHTARLRLAKLNFDVSKYYEVIC